MLADKNISARLTCDFETLADLEAGIKVHATVLVFDDNRRIYSDVDSGPIYRGYFKRAKVHSETSRSWVLNHENGRKISKKTLDGLFSDLCADEMGWLHKYGHQISNAVERRFYRKDRDLLPVARALVDLLGLDFPAPPKAE